jgi:S1-C subfamily serine protease
MVNKIRSTFSIAAICILLSLTACTTPTPSGVMPAERAPSLGVTIDQNAVIVDVEPGSSADKAGIKPGEVLQFVGTVALAAPEVTGDVARAQQARMDVKRLLTTSASGSKLSVQVLRQGAPVNLDIELTPSPSRPGQPTPTPVVDPNFYL